MLRDLDHDAPCAGELLEALDHQSAEVRIAVRQIEAWLLADHTGLLTAFATSGWDPERAAHRSASLARAILRLRSLIEHCTVD